MSTTQRYKTVLLFGAPGVGKGTQGKILGCIPGFFHLSTGDMFRALDKDSEMGRLFLSFSTKGELVPDDVTVELWRRYTAELVEKGAYSPEADLLLLDGIPRSETQAELMDEHIDVLRIIHLDCDDMDEMVARLRLRAEREKRADDTKEDVIRRRLSIYRAETQPVLAHYAADKRSAIDALGTPAEVQRRILDVLAPLQRDRFGNALD
ncbi:MAG: nucleoside monophosphate kinase [Phycisphaerales bacterium]|nr:MAG: nucleoside monophosphate kinase [Phycisphaerales bacterium]